MLFAIPKPCTLLTLLMTVSDRVVAKCVIIKRMLSFTTPC